MNWVGYFMSFSLWVIVSWIPLACALAIVLGDFHIQQVRSQQLHKIINTVVFVVSICLLLSPFYVEFPKYPNRLFGVDKKTGEMHEYPYGAFEYGKKLTWLPPGSENRIVDEWYLK